MQYPLLFVVFAVTPFMALVLTTNTPSPPLFFPPLFSILAPLSTWHVLWHLWNGDPGVWQASPVETQRHEKEGQALLALRAACTYCTFIQIAHINCNLDVGFGWFPFRLFFVCFIPTWSRKQWNGLFLLLLPETLSWLICPVRFCTGNNEWEPFPCSKMTKNGNEW